MKPAYTTLAAACGAACINVAVAQTSQSSVATQQPNPSVESQEIHPVPDTQQTTPAAPGTMEQQPVRPESEVPRTSPTGDDTMLADADQNFLENAIQGNHAEIEGSQLALEKTEDPDVREFAQMMVDDHQTMLQEAQELAQQKGLTPPDGPSVMQTTEVTALKALSGGAFDAMYVNRIGVASHQSTIEMFEEARQEVQDPDVQAMIDKTLPKLREHLSMAQALNEKQERQ